AHHALADQFADHSIDRRYLALVANARHLDERGRFETGHARHPNLRKRFTGRVDSQRRAITHYRIMERFTDGSALVACTLETGRTHQIRMHFAEVSSPVLSDALYGTRASETRRIARHALHAELLGFEHPDPDRGRVTFRSPPPRDFMDALTSLRSLTSGS
ncbi:MAG: pseudouridine synthase, partial [Myxococcota bacterium]